MQIRESGAIGIDGKHRAQVRAATKNRRPIQSIARQRQTRIRAQTESWSETINGSEVRVGGIGDGDSTEARDGKGRSTVGASSDQAGRINAYRVEDEEKR